MKKRNAVLAGMMSVAMAAGLLPGSLLAQETAASDLSVDTTLSEMSFLADSASDTDYSDLTTLPGTEGSYLGETSFSNSFLSVTGYAQNSVHDRTEYIGTDYYRVASNELEFLEALDAARNGEVKVIELTADLDLGWDALSEEAQECESISKYGWENNHEINNPTILESGISQLQIANTDGLTIFSRAGNTVRHAEWKLQGTSSDIVIRNLTIDELWYWSEDASSKEAGWTPVKLNGVKGVWLDHCSFTMGSDGCVDSENGSEDMTISWCTYSLPAEEDPGTNSMMYKVMSYMEWKYQQTLAGNALLDKTINKGYYQLRQAGATMEQIMAYEAHHDKLSLNGSGDKDFTDASGLTDGNQRLHLTLAYDKVYSIGQRFPLVRQGTVHMLNCYVDNSEHWKYYNMDAFKNHQRWSLRRAINSRNGGTTGAEGCVFKEMEPIIGRELQGDDTGNMDKDEGWDVAFQNAYNHTLIVNSTVEKDGKTYTGNSWTLGDGESGELFYNNNDPADFFSDYTTIGSFYWYSSIDNVDGYTRGEAPKDEDGNYVPFSISYSDTYTDIKTDESYTGLPYTYYRLPVNEVEETIDAYAGAYALNESPEFWLKTDYSDDTDTYTPANNSGVQATGLELSADELAIDVGSVRQISVDIVPSHANEQEVTWKSSDESVAQVLDSGLVIGVGEGTATITATTKDGTNIAETCEVTVSIPVTGVKVEAPTKTLYLGDDTTPADSVQLTAVITPENATDQSVTWTSSNSSVLKVDSNGVLTPVKKGTNVTITCTSVSNPDVSGTIKISVKEGTNPNATETPTDAPETDAPTETPKTVYKLGDVNGNSKVDADDALQILRHVVGLIDISKLDNGSVKLVLANADEDANGEITASDALVVLKMVVGLTLEKELEL